jgi:magnesium-transporting ATPase (P-type)
VSLQASSPDEEALVQGAAYLGYKLISRTTDAVVVDVQGTRFSYDVLATLEFNSDRKRMSIIVRTPSNKLLLMCKGADTIIYQRLAPYEPGEATAEHLVSTARCANGMHTKAVHADPQVVVALAVVACSLCITRQRACRVAHPGFNMPCDLHCHPGQQSPPLSQLAWPKW